MNIKDDLAIKATIKISKYDNDTGKLVGIEEKEVLLSPKEAERLCHLQRQD